MRRFIFAGLALAATGVAVGQVRITEWAYQGGGGEYIEFTNVSGSPVDMTGWSFDDDSRIADTVSLSAFGILAPGQSAVLTEAVAADFATAWSLSGVPIIGGNVTNLSRNDEINLFDAADAVVDRLAYGDQSIPGTIRTQNIGGIPSSFGALGANDVTLWQLASTGDVFGSYTSLLGDVGNPGTYVPEPGSLALLALGGLLAARRR